MYIKECVCKKCDRLFFVSYEIFNFFKVVKSIENLLRFDLLFPQYGIKSLSYTFAFKGFFNELGIIVQ